MNLETIRFEITTILCLYCKQPVQKELGLDYHIDCQLEILSYIPGFETLQQIEIEKTDVWREMEQRTFLMGFDIGNDGFYADDSDLAYLPISSDTYSYVSFGPITEGKSNALISLNLVFAEGKRNDYIIRLKMPLKYRIKKFIEKIKCFIGFHAHYELSMTGFGNTRYCHYCKYNKELQKHG